jgi:hypothetical protein
MPPNSIAPILPVGAAMLLLVVSVVPVNAQVLTGTRLSIDRTKIDRPKPIPQWQFANANKDLGNPHAQKAEGDWNKIAVVSKPYRDSGGTVKPFAQYG